MRPLPTRLVLGLVSLTLIAGCSSTSEGSPRPVPTSDTKTENTSPTSPSPDTSEPSTDELPFAGAPKVEDPLDTSQLQQDPCQSLTAAQAQELDLNSPGEEREAALGKACRFEGRIDPGARVEIAFLDKDPRGLSAEYQADKDGKWDFFDELGLIEGYPAVARAATDDRPNGGCTVVVGASDEIAFEVALLLSQVNIGKLDPCETSAMVTGMVLRTMKAGQ